MIIPVTREHEKIWAELCVSLWSEDSYDDLIKDGRENGYENQFLFILENEAIAFLSLSLRHDYVEGTETSPVGYIEAIYVKPAFQNQGIAKKLVEFAKEWSIEKGCVELASDCELSNESSRNFHMKIGFEEANKIVCFTMKL